VKILLVSDEESRFVWDFFDKEQFRDVELIVSCGDLKKEYLDFLVSMIPVPLFYVPGNHDKAFRENPPEGCVSIHGKSLLIAVFASSVWAAALARERSHLSTRIEPVLL